MSRRLSAVIALSSALTLSYPATAQILSDQLVNLTNFNCQAMGIDPSGFGNSGLGPELEQICLFSSGGPGSGGGTTNASGGGSTGVGAAGGADAVRRRLAELHEGEDEEAQKSSFQQRGPVKYASASLGSILSSTGSTVGATGTTGAEEIHLFDGLGVFLSGDFEDKDRDTTTFETGYDSTVWGISTGVDYRITDAAVLGVAVNYNRQDGDFSFNGDFDIDTYGVLAYGSYYPEFLPGFFSEVVLGYNRKAFEVDRAIDGIFNAVTTFGTAAGDTDGDEYTAELQLGHDFRLGIFEIGPRGGLAYAYNSTDSTTEEGSTGMELAIDDWSVDSLQTKLGLEGSAAISMGFGVLVPQAGFDWVHEFENDRQHLDARFAQDLRPTPTVFTFSTDQPDRDYFNITAGVVAVLPRGLQVFGQFRTLVGHKFFDSVGGSVGVRTEF